MTATTLYKRDSNGRVRQWTVFVDDDKYWVESGLTDGEKVTTIPKVAQPKNVNKKNATTGAEQAGIEADALVTKQLAQGGYFRTVEEIDNETFFDVMLATPLEKIKNFFPNDTFSQPKLDGVRCAAQVDQLMSRQGKPFTAVPHVAAALEQFFVKFPDVIVDGELYNHDYHDDFNELISVIRKQKPAADDLEKSAKVVQYHVYDVYVPLDPEMTFESRLEWINTNLRPLVDQDIIKFVRTVPINTQEELDSEFGAYLEQGYEGQMIRLDRPYENKRSKFLIKRKEFVDEEYTILDILEGEGNWSGVAKRIHGRMNSDGVEFFSGIRGTKAQMKTLLEERDQYIGGEGTVRYMNRTPSNIENGVETGNKPRFPVTTALWKGKRDV